MRVFGRAHAPVTSNHTVAETNRMRLPIVAGNWKLNGSKESVRLLASEIKAQSVDGVETVVCPVAVHIADVASVVEGSAVRLGAQNAAAHEQGAYTGEVSCSMLAEFGCSHVIVGHSERRSLFGDTDQSCAERHAAVLSAGLTPIFCVGESLEQREAGTTLQVVEAQLNAVFNHVGDTAFDSAVIAYEPVWAIGTGKTASPEQAQDVHAAIRALLARHSAAGAEKVRILYGGSVNPGNADELFAKPDIDGGLIGGAALKSADFLAICEAAAKQAGQV